VLARLILLAPRAGTAGRVCIGGTTNGLPPGPRMIQPWRGHILHTGQEGGVAVGAAKRNAMGTGPPGAGSGFRRPWFVRRYWGGRGRWAGLAA
jgi:hypothetical protein